MRKTRNVLTLIGFLLALLIAMLAPMGLQAQTQPVRWVPDCAMSFTLSSSGNSPNFNNSTIGCDNWALTWEAYGATPAVTVTFQSAPSDSTGLAAGTFATFGGTIFQGTNPSSLVNSSITAVGYASWLRVNVAGLTGNFRATLLGCRMPCTPPANSSGGGGGGSVVVSNFQACSATDNLTTATVSFSALTGNQKIVTASGSTRIYICSMLLSWDNAVNFKLTTGTGTNCGTGTADLTGAFTNVVAASPAPPQMRTPAAVDLCINTSASASGGGFITYVQQ